MTLRAEHEDAPVAAIVVSYNSAAALPALLRSLQASTVGVHTIVVDNGSHDDSVAVARSFAGVTVIETRANLGYSGGINVGRTRVRPGRAIAILNPDLVVEPDALERMLGALGAPGAGIVAPLIRNADGTRFDSLWREPSLLGSLGDAAFGRRWAGRARLLSDTLRRSQDYSRPHEVDWASGAALLVSPECDAATGGWDAARYFLYSEETDFARRARDAGFAVRFEPTAVVHHDGGGSGRSPRLEALAAVNRLRYFESRNSPRRALAFRAILVADQTARAHGRGHRAALRALLDRASWASLPRADTVSGEGTP